MDKAADRMVFARPPLCYIVWPALNAGGIHDSAQAGEEAIGLESASRERIVMQALLI